MLAGALFNRATDIFTAVVDLAERGVHISDDNELMRQWRGVLPGGAHARQAGQALQRRGGHRRALGRATQGLRHTGLGVLRVALREDRADDARHRRHRDGLERVMGSEPGFEGIIERVQAFAAAARLETETMRSDPRHLRRVGRSSLPRASSSKVSRRACRAVPGMPSAAGHAKGCGCCATPSSSSPISPGHASRCPRAPGTSSTASRSTGRCARRSIPADLLHARAPGRAGQVFGGSGRARDRCSPLPFACAI